MRRHAAPLVAVALFATSLLVARSFSAPPSVDGPARPGSSGPTATLAGGRYTGPPFVGVFTLCDPDCDLALVNDGAARRLTFTGAATDESAPSLSPDLQRVAFRCADPGVEPGASEAPRPAGPGSICVLAVGRAGASQPALRAEPLADPRIDFGGPAWAPDGSILAFHFRRESGQAGIGTWVPGSEEWNVLTPVVGEVSNPAWSADGTMLAFTCGGRNGETGLTSRLCVMPSEGNDVTELGALGGSCGTPTFMPDGERIGIVCVAAGAQGGDIFAVGRKEPLTRSLTGDQAIAPEGQRRVVFSSAASYAYVRRDDALFALDISRDAWLLPGAPPLHGDFDLRVLPE